MPSPDVSLLSNLLGRTRPSFLCAASLFLGALLLAAACDEYIPPSKGTGGGPAFVEVGPLACEGGKDVVLSDRTNYEFSNALKISRSVLRSGTDLEFDWSEVTRDFFGDSLDPASDLDLIAITLWRLTPEEIEEGLRHDDLPLSKNMGVLTSYPDGGKVSEKLYDFTLLGKPFDREKAAQFFDTEAPDYGFPQESHTFMVMASRGEELGKDVRMLHLFTLDANAEATRLPLTSESTKLTYEVELEKSDALGVPVGTPDLNVFWSQMTENSLGNKYAGALITKAVVARFTESRAELEKDFLHIEEHATGWWQSENLAGRSVNLGTLTDRDGASFPGIDETATWMVALFCTKECNSPAPWSLHFLEPCP